MRYYILSIFVLTTVLALLNAFVFAGMIGANPIVLALATVLAVVIVIVLDGLTASLVHHLPKKWFDPYHKYLTVSKKEKKILEALGIKKWKDKIPEIGALTCDFGKGKIEDPTDSKYIYEFLIETGYAEVIHNTSCIIGFFLCLFYPPFIYVVGLPVAVINIFYNILSALIQRYNRPKLLTLYERRKRLEKRNEKEE